MRLRSLLPWLCGIQFEKTMDMPFVFEHFGFHCMPHFFQIELALYRCCYSSLLLSLSLLVMLLCFKNASFIGVNDGDTNGLVAVVAAAVAVCLIAPRHAFPWLWALSRRDVESG
jgi:hypothetical protein